LPAGDRPAAGDRIADRRRALPEGRYLPELSSLQGKAIFRPWLTEGFERLDYPPPLVGHEEAADAFRAHRGA
jgi:hypothetical protein